MSSTSCASPTGLKPGLAGLGRHDRGQITDARSDVGSGRRRRLTRCAYGVASPLNAALASGYRCTDDLGACLARRADS